MATTRRRKHRGFCRLTAALLSGIMMVTSCLAGAGRISAAESEDTKLHNPVVEMNTCDTVYFGSYWQEDTNGDGVADQNDDKTPIRWRILSQSGNDAYVLADQGLDCKPYHETDEDVTWETSTLRKWLNEEFYQTAFTEEEQKAVLEQTLVNAENSQYGTFGGADTVDRVYLPSYNDIQQENYGFSADAYATDPARICGATAYAQQQGAENDWVGQAYWWLRSLRLKANNVTIVCDDGYGGAMTCVNDDNYAVRPALHLDLSSPLVRQGGLRGISQKSVSWDLVELGTYEGKPITWRVLSVSGDEVFLLSDRLLTKRAYHETDESITWKDSTLRSWLNGEFYQDNFSEEEKAGICSYQYANGDNPHYDIEGGEDTTDFLTLLSLQDIVNPDYGFPETICSSSARTAYDSQKNESWWLRSPGYLSNRASYVSISGYVFSRGDCVDYDDHAVRPALHFHLSSSHSLNKVGTVTATAEGNEYQDKRPVTPELPEPASFTALLQYASNDWKVQYWADSEEETDIIAKHAEVTGPGKYHVALDFRNTSRGYADGILFANLEILGAEPYYPDRMIRIDDIKINGNSVPSELLEKAYTCSDNDIETRVNLYNAWLSEDDAISCANARSYGKLSDATPYILEDYINEKIITIETSFTYGNREEITQVDQLGDSGMKPSTPTPVPEKPTLEPEIPAPDRPSSEPITPAPGSVTPNMPTPIPDKPALEPEIPAPGRPSSEPVISTPDTKPGGNDLTDDDAERNLRVRGLDIATGNVVTKGFLNVPQVQLTWDRNSRCDGYEIWRKTGNQSFVKVDYVDDPDEIEWFDTKLKKGSKYAYKVLGYVEEDDGSISRSKEGNSVSVEIRKTVKSCTYTAKRTGKNLKITFKKAEGAKYQIQVKYGKSSKWKSVSGSLKKKIVKKVSPRKLKVRVRTGEKINGKMKYSKWSKVKTVQ